MSVNIPTPILLIILVAFVLIMLVLLVSATGGSSKNRPQRVRRIDQDKDWERYTSTAIVTPQMWARPAKPWRPGMSVGPYNSFHIYYSHPSKWGLPGEVAFEQFLQYLSGQSGPDPEMDRWFEQAHPNAK